jgi:hypothetical protein
MATMEFTEWIRGRTDEQLRALVSARPELITPVPAHLEGLASRAGSPSAIGRVLDRLDRFTLAVVEKRHWTWDSSAPLKFRWSRPRPGPVEAEGK